ncbi:uncharacterized protein [Pyrus communis]|uniref:uncharacterized protein n=1 Tax=Pyrus communis TaxID=23211 RepID=UPI0035C168A2
MKRGTVPKTYTKFSVPINQILYHLKDKSWFKPPPPMIRDTSKIDHTKFCAFHRGSGHTTNDCTTWMKYLEKFMKEGKCNYNSKKKKIQLARLVVQVQATDVVPGPIVGFTEQNAEGVDFPHNDALVISIQLAHAIVDRIMVDNGSSVNILQLSVIQKMSLESMIKCKSEVITVFNRLTLTVIGTIMLDITSSPIVSSQTFMIINDPISS